MIKTMKYFLSHPITEIRDFDVSKIVREVAFFSKIPSPTFHEGRRAQYVLKKLKGMGIEKSQLVGNQNVLAQVGKGKGPNLLIAAHLDTFFSPGKDINIREQGKFLIGPGVGDNALGVVAGLNILEHFKKLKFEPLGTLIFAGTTCEEGLGNLRGITEVLDFLNGKINFVIALEGLFQGRLSHQAIGVARWKIRFQGPGGHSWEGARTPNPNHALIQIGNALLSKRLPPLTTLNLSIIEGGEAINSISTSASVSIDIRSLREKEVIRLSSFVQKEAKKVARLENLRVTLTPLGKRPAGRIPKNHMLVHVGREIHRCIGIKSEYTPMSSDTNIPLSMGIPSLTVGIAQGGNCHREDEYIETNSIAVGLKQLILFSIILTGLEDFSGKP